MPITQNTASGTIEVSGTPTSRTLTIQRDPPNPNLNFSNPPDWVWDLVKGNVSRYIEIKWDVDDSTSPPTVTITSVKVR